MKKKKLRNLEKTKCKILKQHNIEKKKKKKNNKKKTHRSALGGMSRHLGCECVQYARACERGEPAKGVSVRVFSK